MAHGTVLVIEDDEWVAQLLAAAIRDAGYEVSLAHTAHDGVAKAVEVEPDCIVCDADLPDETGHFVVRTVRTQPTRVSVTPFVFLSEHDDEASRLEGFQVGADVYMTKPFRVDEVVAQVGALVHMAVRLRRRRDTLLSIPPLEAGAGKAFEGDLGQMSIATVLTVLELERRSGTFEVVSKKRKASLEVASGCVVGAAIGGTTVTPLDALRTLLGWNVGRFAFTLSETRPAPSGMATIGNLLLEAARLEDEGTSPPSLRGRPRPDALAPTLGGRASSEHDLAPPSSRGVLLAKRASTPPPAPKADGPPLRAPRAPRFTPAPASARREPEAPKAASEPPAPEARSPSLDDEWDVGPLSQRGPPNKPPKPPSNRPPRPGSNRPPATRVPRPLPKTGTQEPKK